jgi:predicted nucleotidyltransferase
LNSSSRWRIDLAQQISRSYSDHPHIKAIMVVGSAAYGWADDYSDIDLTIVWDTVPDPNERTRLI